MFNQLIEADRDSYIDAVAIDAMFTRGASGDSGWTPAYYHALAAVRMLAIGIGNKTPTLREVVAELASRSKLDELAAQGVPAIKGDDPRAQRLAARCAKWHEKTWGRYDERARSAIVTHAETAGAMTLRAKGSGARFTLGDRAIGWRECSSAELPAHVGEAVEAAREKIAEIATAPIMAAVGEAPARNRPAA